MGLTGETFDMEVNEFNEQDICAVAVGVDDKTVGYLPIEISKEWWLYYIWWWIVRGKIWSVLKQ